MSFQLLLATLVEALESEGIPFMLTGSLASSYHGTPRATQDIDFVVNGSMDRILGFAAAMKRNGLYVSDEAVREAVLSRGMFKVVDPESGWKADFILLKNRPFSLSEFADRETTEFAGIVVSLARAEDLIVAKLEWSRMGGSERQIRDVAGILAAQGDLIDYERIARWVGEMGLEAEWEAARKAQA